MKNKLESSLIKALEDEYKAQASYRVIIQKFGEIHPFINIVEAEGRHIQVLLPIFEKYGFSAPEDTWESRVERPETILEACKIGVEAEIENAELYNKLLADTTDYDDVQAVFKNLQRASQENHLPAFQRCVERGGTEGGKAQGSGREGKGHGRHNGGGNGSKRNARK